MLRDRQTNPIRMLRSGTTMARIPPLQDDDANPDSRAALDKARGMMDAYEVTETDLELTRTEAAVLQSAAAHDPHSIKSFLSCAVARFCDCKIWRSRVGGLTICGLPSDTQLATWLLDSLAMFVQGELANHLMGNPAPKGARRRVINGFVMGCTSRISHRLDELTFASKTTIASNGRALVVAKESAIAAAMAKAGIKWVITSEG